MIVYPARSVIAPWQVSFWFAGNGPTDNAEAGIESVNGWPDSEGNVKLSDSEVLNGRIEQGNIHVPGCAVLGLISGDTCA